MTALARAQMAKLAAEIESVRPVPEWDQVADLKKYRATVKLKDGEKKLNFEQLIDKFTDIKSEIKYREALLAGIKESIETALAVSGEDAVTAIGYKVAVIRKQGSRKIVAEKLLAAGVSAMVIAGATEQGKEITYVDIRKAKED